MSALVVYESMFGNTRTIAEAIAEGLSEHTTTEAVEVGIAPVALRTYDIVVVGGPTHAFGMSRKGTREGAVKETREPLVSQRIGIREWIDSVSLVGGTNVATFDTRFNKPHWMTGSAARGAAKHLRARGCRVVVPPESFFVSGMTGPLVDDEVGRARAWGRRLGAEVLAAAQSA